MDMLFLPPLAYVIGGAAIAAWIGVIIAAAGTAYSVHQGQQQSKQSEMNAQANADQEAANAERAAQEKENQAEQERLNHQAKSKEERKSQRRRKAIMEGSYAKSGVLLDGSPGEYLAAQTEADEVTVQQGNQRSEARALGLQINGQAMKSEGLFNSNMMQGKADAYGRQANSQLISGGIEVAKNASSSYYSWMNNK